MNLASLAFILLMTPGLILADQAAELNIWVEKHSIQEAFPLEKAPPTLDQKEKEMWNECLKSGLFPLEVAYLSDVLVAAGKAEDVEQHQRLSDAIEKVLCVDMWSFRGRLPKPLASSYLLVRTWLMVHTDPTLQNEETGWIGLMDELDGLSFSQDEAAKVIIELLDRMEDPNVIREITAFQKLRLYMQLSEIEHMNKKLQARLIHHNWEIPAWNPATQGSPKEIRDEVNAWLVDRSNRLSWASFLFSMAWWKIGPGITDNTKDEQWAREFQQVTQGMWLEGLAKAYEEGSNETLHMVAYPLFEREGRVDFQKLPLSFQRLSVFDWNMQRLILAHPDQAQAVLACCVETLTRTIRAITEIPEDETYLLRYAVMGKIGPAIMERYPEDPESSRAFVREIQEAYDSVFSQELGERADEIRSGLEPIADFLERCALLEKKLEK
jgi:hypothetical protein